MGLVAGIDPEDTEGGIVAGLAGGSRHGELEHTPLVGPQPLFSQIKQNIATITPGRLMFFGQRRVGADVIHPLRLFNGHAGVDVAAVHPVEAGHQGPVLAVERLKGLVGLDEA